MSAVEIPERSRPNEYDADMCHPQPCRNCGFAWRVHRCGNNLCPLPAEDGGHRTMDWPPFGGTTYEPREP